MRRGPSRAVLLACALAGCGDPPRDPGPLLGTDNTGATGDSDDDAPLDDSTSGAPTDDGLDSTGEDTTTTGEPPDDPGDPFDPAPPLPILPDATLAEIAADIDAALANPGVAGTTQGVLIHDAETGQEIYAKNPDLLLKPASNTKLLSSAAAMESFGAEHSMLTDVRADATPDVDGNIPGDLHLIMHHDFSWSPQFLAPDDFALDQIAAELFDLGLRSVGGGLLVHGEAIYGGDSLSTYNAAAHRTAAANAFASSLAGAGIAVTGGTNTAADFAEPGESLYTWRSPPLLVGCTPMNSISHNEFADILVRHIGHEVAGDSSYGAGGQAVIDWLASLPTSVEGIALNDGSGLSHENRVSATTVSDTLRFMLGTPAGLPWVRGLSIAGVRGTLSGRMLGADTFGRVFGKSGTLTGVIATSGIAYNRHDGRRYTVAILMNDVGDNNSARAVQDDVFEIIARDHYGTARPEAPTLATVRAAESDVVEIAWSPVDGATGYLVWLSDDGALWNRSDARLVADPTHRAGELPFGPDVFVRITAVGPGGESEASDAYGGRGEEGLATVLVVDGFDRWQAEPMFDNPLGGAHDFAVAVGVAFGGAVIWDVAANEVVIDGQVDLSDYAAVFWVLGEESTDDETFDASEQQQIADYLDLGGHIFVSGAELGWDLVANGDPADAAFLSEVLHTDYIEDDAATFTVRGAAGLRSTLPPTGFFTPATLLSDFPDQLAPGPGAETILTYVGGFGGAAGIATDTVVVLGFPFETLDNAQARAVVMASALQRFGL